MQANSKPQAQELKTSTLPKKLLFTPGPVSVSSNVRQALNHDVGSRDPSFTQIFQNLRSKLVEIAGLSNEEFTAVLLQGTGSYAMESVLQTTSDRSKKVLILSCGAYGKRMEEICTVAQIPYEIFHFPENEPVSLNETIECHLKSGEFSTLGIVHCETTSGLMNPVEKIGKKLKSQFPNVTYVVDAVSSFGGVETDFHSFDFIISTANKCMQGVPGFAFVICRRDKLEKCRGRSTSLSLDLYEQWKELEKNGQFRYTPPTHCILGLVEAIKELENEGGVRGRAVRYKENNTVMRIEMEKLGFSRFVSDENDGHILTSFRFPSHPNFKFDDFYNRLSEKGKVTNADCFRIGNIGHLFPTDMRELVFFIKEVLLEMNIKVPLEN